MSGEAEKTDAIVLRSVEWSETSAVVTLMTRGFGKVSAIAKGARRLRSPFESALDLLSRSHVVFIAKSGDTLDLLTEAKLSRRFRSAQRALLPLYCGYYVAELLVTLTENHQCIPHLFDLTDQTLVDLDNGLSPASVVLRFELQLMGLLGLLPSLERCVSCGQEIDTTTDRRAISVVGGGALCELCVSTHQQVLRVTHSTFGTLHRFTQCDWQSSLPDIDVEQRGEVRFVMDRIMNHLADRRLRLSDFLEELKR